MRSKRIFFAIAMHTLMVNGYLPVTLKRCNFPTSNADSNVRSRLNVQIPSEFGSIEPPRPPIVSPGLSEEQIKRRKFLKRWFTGWGLGAIGTLWIFSGNGPFTLGFLVASLIALNEYYSMVKAAGARVGIAPASKTGTVSSLLCYVVGKSLPSVNSLFIRVCPVLRHLHLFKRSLLLLFYTSP